MADDAENVRLAGGLRPGLRAGESAELIEFREAAGAVRDAQADVFQRREAHLLAGALLASATDELDRAMARLTVAEVALKAAPPIKHDDERVNARLVDDGISLAAARESGKHYAAADVPPMKGGAILGLQRQRAGEPRAMAKGETSSADYWQRPAPRRWRLFGKRT